MQRMSKAKKWLQRLCCVLLLFGTETPAAASDSSAQVGSLTAAFVYNFAKFVDWPASTFPVDDAPLLLCVPDTLVTRTRMDLLEGRSANGHPIHLLGVETAKSATQCHILFFPATTDAERQPWLDALLGQPVLTVSMGAAATHQGGIVALFQEQNHLRFSINLAAAHAGGLKISARMLQLAKSVTTDLHGGGTP